MNQVNHGPLLRKLALIIVLMFGFAFALVPLYDVFCRITGLNGKTADRPATVERTVIDDKRTIQVEFLAHADTQMPWQFNGETQRLSVKPGEMRQVNFKVFNPTDSTMVGQAVPSVSPGTAAAYLKKVECFCFNRQELKAGESKLMPLKFYVDPALPDDINTITLSYSLYDITESKPAPALAQRK
ncbi:cytochrome c oxidase assembly protein [Aeromonas hydrophila]|jgi:cytochrome c oxidase assembly protein subunit 11|uniref:cytochrome c oxidase assembly protein n=1 Tax=Aeromonas hydrophila TaxID=644 RepID=UPI00209E5657|nr:cytochrome c oxidase assembly protein [Aeromonas hydrophila]MCP1267813.1 cytochrome c oxidase assembly protein [Aeromonas hydrophila]MCP1295750.1 cytochrome c oxidase assembly protein [Aeromonas hydrophila]